MAWYLEWGNRFEFLSEIEENTGVTPSGLLNKPELKSEEVSYVNMFWTLHAGRSYGMSGALPLQISEIDAYYRLIDEIDSEERMRGLMYMQRMDQVYLEHASKKAETKAK